MNGSVLESVRAWFMAFPQLGPGVFGADTLEALSPAYAVRGLDDAVLRRYLDGSCLRRFDFTFESREAHGADTRQALAVRRFYDGLAGWVARRARAGELPELPGGRIARAIAVTAQAGAEPSGEDSARWSLRLCLTYWQPEPI